MPAKKKSKPISIDAQKTQRLGRNIAAVRNFMDLTQEEAGSAIGKNADWWGRIERGETNLLAIDLIPVCRLLKDAPENLVEMDYQEIYGEAG